MVVVSSYAVKLWVSFVWWTAVVCREGEACPPLHNGPESTAGLAPEGCSRTQVDCHHRQLCSELQWALCLVNSSECWRVRELSPWWGPHPMGAFSPRIHLNSDLLLHVPPNLPPREMGHERVCVDGGSKICCAQTVAFQGVFLWELRFFPSDCS